MTESRGRTELPPEVARLPEHIAVIMDGNGRWAKSRSLPRIEGHREGAKSVRAVVTACRELEIPWLTLYAFSEENWNRPKTEVQGLMSFLKHYLKSELPTLIENEIAFDVIGDEERLPKSVRKTIADAREKAAGGKKMRLSVALSYGGRSEIVRAARQLAEEVQRGEITPDQIDKAAFAQRLYTADMPDPDLLIRTSGEMRISNFLLWQVAYTELYITPVLWPDFRKEQLIQALVEFNKRERRFGRTRPVEVKGVF